MESTVCPANCTSKAGSASSQHQMSESCANTQTPVLNVCKKRKRSAASGGSPLTLRPNFKSEKGSVTADKPPVCPAGGVLLMRIYCDSFLCNLRVILESYSTSGMRTLFFFCFFFLFSKESGESPLTLRPNFKCEKGSVTADKPPVRPAGGVLLMCNLRVIFDLVVQVEREFFSFLLLFFFSVKKKRSVTPCEISWLL